MPYLNTCHYCAQNKYLLMIPLLFLEYVEFTDVGIHRILSIRHKIKQISSLFFLFFLRKKKKKIEKYFNK